MQSKALVVATLSFVAGLAGASPAHAAEDSSAGARLGYYSDADAPFAGGELLFRLAPSFYFNPNLEVVFRDDSFLSVSADFHYDFHRRSGTSVWAGAGLGILAVNPPGPRGGNTDVGLNLLFGVAFPRRSLTPYLQAKVVAKQDSEFSLGIGLRF